MRGHIRVIYFIGLNYRVEYPRLKYRARARISFSRDISVINYLYDVLNYSRGNDHPDLLFASELETPRSDNDRVTVESLQSIVVPLSHTNYAPIIRQYLIVQ